MDKGADRPGDLIGHQKTDQAGGQQDQQRDDGEDEGESYLQPGAVFIQPLIFGHGLLGTPHVPQDGRVDGPADHQRQGRCGGQPHHGADTCSVPFVQDGDIAIQCDLGCGGGRRFQAHAHEKPRRGQNLTRYRFIDHGLGQAAQCCLGVQNAREDRRIGRQVLSGAGDIVRHFQGDGANIVPVLFKVAVRDLK